MSGEITVNGDRRDWSDQSMTDLLQEFEIDPSRAGVAVALNADVLPRGAWETTRLRPGDAVEIVHIVRGG